MAETKIEWTATTLPDGTKLPGFTFNPWVGCQKVSFACDNCYAETWAKRAGNPELWQGERRRTTAENWMQPLKWNREAERSGIRRKVFCASLADVFDNQVPAEWRNDLWDMIGMTRRLDWLLLTKRPQNILKMLPDPQMGVKPWGDGWSNVWLGTTVENQTEADRRTPHLRAVPASVRFLSCEPLLSAIKPDLTGIDWVICGGESGPQARPMHPDWARGLRDQCQAADVPFFFKQSGCWISVLDRDKDDPDWRYNYTRADREGDHAFLNLAGGCGFHGERMQVMKRVTKEAAGRLLDGREWSEMPDGAAGIAQKVAP